MVFVNKPKDFLEDQEDKILEHYNDVDTTNNYVIDLVSDSLNGISVEAKHDTILWYLIDNKVVFTI